MRVDGEARVLAREALFGFREAELVAQHVHQVGGVAAVENAEARVEADRGGVSPNQPIGDRVKGAGPGQTDVLAGLKPCASGRFPVRNHIRALHRNGHIVSGQS